MLIDNVEHQSNVAATVIDSVGAIINRMDENSTAIAAAVEE
jgi:hypothetical protein